VDRSLDENNFMIQGKIFFSYNSSSNNKPIWKNRKKIFSVARSVVSAKSLQSTLKEETIF